jgi:hypothetical protein
MHSYAKAFASSSSDSGGNSLCYEDHHVYIADGFGGSAEGYDVSGEICGAERISEPRTPLAAGETLIETSNAFAAAGDSPTCSTTSYAQSQITTDFDDDGLPYGQVLLTTSGDLDCSEQNTNGSAFAENFKSSGATWTIAAGTHDGLLTLVEATCTVTHAAGTEGANMRVKISAPGGSPTEETSGCAGINSSEGRTFHIPAEATMSLHFDSNDLVLGGLLNSTIEASWTYTEPEPDGDGSDASGIQPARSG